MFRHLRMTFLMGRQALTRFTVFFIVISLMSACSWRSAGGNRNANRGGANSNANSDAQDAPITVTVGKSEARNRRGIEDPVPDR